MIIAVIVESFVFQKYLLKIETNKEQGQAGPAWLGGPRVLGRAGLAWGAKGPGPDRLGLLHFQKVQYLIVFNLKGRNNI